jgi:predicted TIM-barrel fold metal-dependent hydrolase
MSEHRTCIMTEEHFMSKKVNDHYKKIRQPKSNTDQMRENFADQFVENSLITDLGEKRIAFMDEHGVKAQIVGYGNNSPMHFTVEEGAVEYCHLANDELYEATVQYPGRLYGYATLPAADVDASVRELERCIKDLHFKGVMFNGGYQDEFLDLPKYFPIFEKAAELDVPVYFHPHIVGDAVTSHYYEGEWSDMTANIFSGYAIGWHYDTAMHLMRMILSGILDKLPDLKLIVGHWGELLPFYFERMNGALNPQLTGLKHDLRYYFEHNVYITPSGIFDENDFDFCLKTVNQSHLLWSQDFPYRNQDADAVVTLLDKADPSVRDAIAFGTAEKLFKL